MSKMLFYAYVNLLPTIYSIGKGVLARNGEFWYPGRLIDRVFDEDESATIWRIKWWRGCQSSSDEVIAGASVMINEEDIVDSLYGKRDERRKIRVCFYRHPQVHKLNSRRLAW